MKLKLRLSREKRKEVTYELECLGVEITDDSDLVLTEENYREGELVCRAQAELVIVPLEGIIYIDTFGKEVVVHVNDKKYTTPARLCSLERDLPENMFLRISNSVIIRRDSIKRIRPGLSQKMFLTLKNGDLVDVTRSYYHKFKDYYGI